jgi:ubiquinone/menaquinone biosynthesis C-methylase UbiE
MEKRIREFYDQYYSDVVSTGLVGRYQIRIHALIESGLPRKTFKKVLELGAGKLEHSRYSRISFDEYVATDLQMDSEEKIVEIEDKASSVKKKIKTFSLDAQDLSIIEDSSIDLLIATCLLIHLNNPYKALIEWRRVLENSAYLVVYVPCDPGVLIRFLRQVTNKRKYKKLGFAEYDFICSFEHLSSVHVLNNLIKDVFRNDQIKIRRGPIRFLNSWNLNLYHIYTIKITKQS